MADAKKAEESAEPPKKKGKLLLFIIIGVVILVLGAGGAILALKKKPPADGEEEDPVHETKPKKADKKKVDPHGPPAFYKFEKPFVVKLVAEQADMYLQVEMQMKLLDPKSTESIKQFDPELKHKITLILMGKRAADINTPQGVQRLSNEIRDAVNNIIDPPPPSKKGKHGAAAPVQPVEPAEEADPEQPVQSILFTSFIFQ